MLFHETGRYDGGIPVEHSFLSGPECTILKIYFRKFIYIYFFYYQKKGYHNSSLNHAPLEEEDGGGGLGGVENDLVSSTIISSHKDSTVIVVGVGLVEIIFCNRRRSRWIRLANHCIRSGKVVMVINT